jgi:stage IV sporulation protein FB
MLRWRRVEISGGFLLLMAFLYYWDDENILPWALAACGVHELGHWAAIRLLGGRVTALRLSCVGAEMRLSARHPLSWGRQMGAALAGPAVNLLLAVGAAHLAGGEEGLYLFSGLNLALGLFNLLPAGPLDGGRILWYGTALLGSERIAGRVVRIASMVVSSALAACAAALLAKGQLNLTLLLTALWLCIPPCVECGGGKRAGKKRNFCLQSTFSCGRLHKSK